jgi:glycosyltransferase involved in cell wall biosynthesis
VSEAVRSELATGYGFAARKLLTVQNGIDVAAFCRDRDARARIRAGWGIAPDALVLGAVGRLAEMKGYGAAIAAFARVMQELPGADLHLVLAGEGPQRQALENAARAAGIGNRVRFPGFTSAPQEVLSALDVFVMPSLTEGLPLALLEAMACQCVPVATAVGGIPEVLTDPSFGWLVPPGDEHGFAGAMKDAAQTRVAELSAMGQRARARVSERFSAHTQFARVADAIEGVLRAR